MLTSEAFPAIRAQLFADYDKYAKQQNILDHSVATLQADLDKMAETQAKLKAHVENLKLAATVLQELVDAVSQRNLMRTEELVNSALATIFPDQEIRFRILSEIKRNTVQYRVAIIQDGHEGTINSYGGGPVSVIALVLKLLFNVLAKRYPFLAFDESLSFLSEKYIDNASAFIKEMSDEFKMPILFVTHQPKLAAASDQTYEASPGGLRTVKFSHRVNDRDAVREPE